GLPPAAAGRGLRGARFRLVCVAQGHSAAARYGRSARGPRPQPDAHQAAGHRGQFARGRAGRQLPRNQISGFSAIGELYLPAPQYQPNPRPSPRRRGCHARAVRAPRQNAGRV
nr:hypothetical protein [Tanacetum cinerariifolium]